jgi:hypothetical protein
VVPCKDHKISRVAADLESACASTCLTRPFQCHECIDATNQVTWKRKTCGHIRCSKCTVWTDCANSCNQIVLAVPSTSVPCDDCAKDAAGSVGRGLGTRVPRAGEKQ